MNLDKIENSWRQMILLERSKSCDRVFFGKKADYNAEIEQLFQLVLALCSP